MRNLLTDWTTKQLSLFFGKLPVAEWFNRTAPQVESSEVILEQIDAETALAMIVNNPILIRRPLMQIGDRRVGFNTEQIDAWIGLSAVKHLRSQNLQTCPLSNSTHI